MGEPRRRTKIVATIGPASESPAVLTDMVAAGMDVARLNLSHGDLDGNLDRLRALRAVSAASGQPLGVLADLPGPKIRSGSFLDGGQVLVAGAEVQLVPGDETSTSTRDVIAVDYAPLLEDVQPGDRVVLGDGAIGLLVESVAESSLLATVTHGGRVQGRPGVHLPSERVRLSAPTEEDLELLEVMVGAGVDFVAVSFVRDGTDVREVKDAIAGRGPLVVAKIETPTAASVHLEEVVDEADVVMVARGDLGIECPLEDVPHLQKRIIAKALVTGRPVITATQMLESMVHAPAPTRAEASDVANAVLDGTDAVMLSGETAVGDDPAGVVATMARIACRAEAEAEHGRWAARLARHQRAEDAERPVPVTQAMTAAAWRAATEAGATAILCCTSSGGTARMMARFRPRPTLVGLSPDHRVVRQLTVSYGVVPVHVAQYASTDEMVWFAIEAALRHGLVDHGDLVAVLAGALQQPQAQTDVLRLVRLA